jgi:hypothetical protein
MCSTSLGTAPGALSAVGCRRVKKADVEGGSGERIREGLMRESQ